MEYKRIYYVQNKRTNRLFNIYKAMIRRCYSEKHMYYKYYGGKGITVCDEWLNDFNKFVDWALDNGFKNQPNTKRSLLLSIDRIDNNKGYCPENCQWITIGENVKKGRVGVPLSKEHRQKIIKSLIGRKHSEETKNKMSEAHKGKSHSKEHTEKVAAKHRKKVVCLTTNEVIEGITNASKKYNCDRSDITRCCQGKIKSAGKLPDGTKLEWQYYDDYVDSNS